MKFAPQKVFYWKSTPSSITVVFDTTDEKQATLLEEMDDAPSVEVETLLAPRYFVVSILPGGALGQGSSR